MNETLIGEMIEKRIIDYQNAEALTTEKSSIRRIDKLLSILSRKSATEFELFVDILNRTGQEHVVQAMGLPGAKPCDPPARTGFLNTRIYSMDANLRIVVEFNTEIIRCFYEQIEDAPEITRGSAVQQFQDASSFKLVINLCILHLIESSGDPLPASYTAESRQRSIQLVER